MSTTFEKTWTGGQNYLLDSANAAAGTGKNIAWYIKAFLKGEAGGASPQVAPVSGLWTHYGSCDSSTANINSSTDLWTSTYTISKLVRNTAGNAHSWMWLKSPTLAGTNWYLCLDMSTASDNSVFNIILAKTAPTGGSTTARATSTDEVAITAQNWDGGLTGGRAHMCLSSDGNWYFMYTRGTGVTTVVITSFIFQALADAKSGDAYPVVFYASGNQVSTTSSLAMSNLTTAANWIGRNAANNATLANLSLGELCWNNSSGAVMTDMTTIDYTDGLYGDLPLYVVNNVAGAYTLKGRLYDIRRAPDSLPELYCEASPSSPASIKVGSLWLPLGTGGQVPIL